MEIYIVKKGDTIYKIAKKKVVSVSRLISDNGLLQPDKLAVGQALLILKPATVHTVKPKDTLQSIADLYNTTVLSLIQNNPSLAVYPTLNIGQQLTVSYKVPRKREIVTDGYAYPFINKNLLKKTLPFLSRLTIFGYGFTQDGKLIPIDDDELIRLSYQYQTAPIMLFTSLTEDGNFSTERASLLFNNVDVQNKLIEQIIETMKKKGYLGLDIDFEFIKPEDKQAFASFIENITKKVNAEGFTVNVDLAPKTNITQAGILYEAHDYEKIGSIADTVLLMTYEWGYTYGPPLAVAPLNNVKEVVDFAVTQIPDFKILMGIPNYGYDWTLPFEQGISKATSIGNDYAVTVAYNNNAQIQYDEKSQSPFFNYYDKNGKKHVVWFEDIRSIMAKYGLIDSKNLLGSGYWNIMRAFAPNWNFINANYKIKKLNR